MTLGVLICNDSVFYFAVTLGVLACDGSVFYFAVTLAWSSLPWLCVLACVVSTLISLSLAPTTLSFCLHVSLSLLPPFLSPQFSSTHSHLVKPDILVRKMAAAR